MGTIVFELNEVPWKVMDWFCERNPQSAFARMLGRGRHYEASAEDSGHLHPWVTWPSLHRGVNNDSHGIGHLGQDLTEMNKAYPTVWELMRKSGRSIGIGGSIHSYPVPQDESNIGFYIPDTFASSPETIPPALSSFQGVSLRLTKENGRNVSGRTDMKTSAKLLAALPRIGVTPGAVIEIGSQLLRERSDKTKLNRRRAMQSVLYFDVFMSQLRQKKPEFSTFFTNHVAASMHRFWAATFPNDYSEFKLPDYWSKNYINEIEWSMNLADGFAARLMQFCERNPGYRLVVCSSMGQAATSADPRAGSFQLKKLERFFGVLGVEPSEYRQAMAMAPDVSVHMLTERAADRVRAAMPSIVDTLGGEWDMDERNMFHANISVEESAERAMPEALVGNRYYSLADIGFEFVPDQDGVGLTAYHVPEGILMVWNPAEERSNGWTRESVGALEIAPAMLKAHGVTPPDYMRQTSLSLS